MSDELGNFGPPKRSTRLDDIDRDIIKLQDGMSSLRERVSSLEGGMAVITKSMEELKRSFSKLETVLVESAEKRQEKVIGAFFRMFVIFGAISVISIIGIVGVVGYSLSLKGFGVEIAGNGDRMLNFVPELQKRP